MNDTARRSGILLHPTSLPGPYGIGDLGVEAHRFVDFLEASGQTLWQVLPLGPTGYGDSPYASFSTFAGNPLLIALEPLVHDGDLTEKDLADRPNFPPDKVEFGPLTQWKIPLLAEAARRFLSRADHPLRGEFEAFRAKEARWLDDFALFMALQDHFRRKNTGSDGLWFRDWDPDIRLRSPGAVNHWQGVLADEVAVRQVQQFWFFRQWADLKAHANRVGVRIIGDIPIFVAPDSADVWANRKYFLLDDQGAPRVVAGVPPDYFSTTGQLWGNPLYDWEALKADGFGWWIDRIEATLKLVDIIRVDHFRGFEAYWEIPYGAPNAVHGRWVQAPGYDLFETVRRRLGALPILAEDLGMITPEVERLRDHFQFPGMKILQFAFEVRDGGYGAENPFLPHWCSENSVVYTGTHDNNTTRGWFEAEPPAVQDYFLDYIRGDRSDPAWSLVQEAWASRARFALAPAQDLLNLPAPSRMNLPSTLGTNWVWRLVPGALDSAHAFKLKHLTRLYGR